MNQLTYSIIEIGQLLEDANNFRSTLCGIRDLTMLNLLPEDFYSGVTQLISEAFGTERHR